MAIPRVSIMPDPDRGALAKAATAPPSVWIDALSRAVLRPGPIPATDAATVTNPQTGTDRKPVIAKGPMASARIEERPARGIAPPVAAVIAETKPADPALSTSVMRGVAVDSHAPQTRSSHRPPHKADATVEPETSQTTATVPHRSRRPPMARDIGSPATSNHPGTTSPRHSTVGGTTIPDDHPTANAAVAVPPAGVAPIATVHAITAPPHDAAAPVSTQTSDETADPMSDVPSLPPSSAGEHQPGGRPTGPPTAGSGRTVAAPVIGGPVPTSQPKVTAYRPGQPDDDRRLADTAVAQPGLAGLMDPSAPAAAPASPAYALSAPPTADMIVPATPTALAAAVTALSHAGHASAVLRLAPPDMGKLTIHIAYAADAAVNLAFTVSTVQAAQLLGQGMDDLRHAMAAAGLRVGQALIGSRPDGHMAGGHQGRDPGTERSMIRQPDRLPSEAMPLASTIRAGARAIA